MGVEKRGDWVGAGENEKEDEGGVCEIRRDRVGDFGMTVWESSSTLSLAFDSVDLLGDLLGDLLWDFRRFSNLDIFLVTSDAAGGVGNILFEFPFALNAADFEGCDLFGLYFKMVVASRICGNECSVEYNCVLHVLLTTLFPPSMLLSSPPIV